MRTVKVEFKDYLCIATIQRPEVHNAVNFAVMDELEALLTKLKTDNKTRCLILKGNEDAFISGGDLREFHAIKTAEEARPMARRILSILERIETLPCWTIACINGPAYGGGCEIMLAFDFCIAAQKATFGFTQGKFYLPPGWGGLTRLIERVGRSTALQWLAEAAVIDAKTALKQDLINRVEPIEKLEKETEQWAKDLSHNGRDYINTLKKGALKFTESRWKAIHNELKAFGSFWEDDRHHQRVEKFLNRSKKQDT